MIIHRYLYLSRKLLPQPSKLQEISVDGRVRLLDRGCRSELMVWALVDVTLFDRSGLRLGPPTISVALFRVEMFPRHSGSTGSSCDDTVDDGFRLLGTVRIGERDWLKLRVSNKESGSERNRSGWEYSVASRKPMSIGEFAATAAGRACVRACVWSS